MRDYTWYSDCQDSFEKIAKIYFFLFYLLAGWALKSFGDILLEIKSMQNSFPDAVLRTNISNSHDLLTHLKPSPGNHRGGPHFGSFWLVVLFTNCSLSRGMHLGANKFFKIIKKARKIQASRCEHLRSFFYPMILCIK